MVHLYISSSMFWLPYLAIYLSVYRPISLSIYLYLSIYLPISLSFYLYLYLHISWLIYLFIYPSIYRIHLPFHPPLCPSFFPTYYLLLALPRLCCPSLYPQRPKSLCFMLLRMMCRPRTNSVLFCLFLFYIWFRYFVSHPMGPCREIHGA